MTNRLRVVYDQPQMPPTDQPDDLTRVLDAAARVEALRRALAQARHELRQALDEAERHG